MKNVKKGFTLIELLVVISILGMMASVVLVALQSARVRGMQGAGNRFESNLYQNFGAKAAAIYNLDETSGKIIADLSDNGNTLRILNAATEGVDFSWGQGMTKNALTIITSSGAPATRNPGNGNPQNAKGLPKDNYTISVWVNPATTPAGTNQTLVSWGNYNTTDGAAIFQLKNFYPYLQRGADPQQSNTLIPTAVWTQIVISVSGTSANVYVNGKKTDTLTFTGASALDTNSSLSIGYSSTGASSGTPWPYYGSLDMVRVYTEALQTAQIEQLYALESPKFLARQ